MRLTPIHLTCLLALVTVPALGCAGRYNSLRSGDYSCTATLVSNTCDETLPATSTFTSPLQGGGTDTFGIDLPSPNSRFEGDVVLQTMQFGIQTPPESYRFTSGVPCRPGTGLANPPTTASISVDAELVTVGTDAIDVTITNEYPDFAACTESPTTSAPCAIAWTVHCAKTP